MSAWGGGAVACDAVRAATAAHTAAATWAAAYGPRLTGPRWWQGLAVHADPHTSHSTKFQLSKTLNPNPKP